MGSPDRLSSLDKSKDGMRVDVIGIRKPIAQDGSLEGQDMGPAGLFFDQGCVENETAIIIEGSDQIPFLLSPRCPKVIGRVVLDELTGIMG